MPAVFKYPHASGCLLPHCHHSTFNYSIAHYIPHPILPQRFQEILHEKPFINVQIYACTYIFNQKFSNFQFSNFHTYNVCVHVCARAYVCRIFGSYQLAVVIRRNRCPKRPNMLVLSPLETSYVQIVGQDANIRHHFQILTETLYVSVFMWKENKKSSFLSQI